MGNFVLFGENRKHIMNITKEEFGRDDMIAFADKQNAKYGKTVICFIDELESRDFSTAKLTGQYDVKKGDWTHSPAFDNITAGEFYNRCGYHVAGFEGPGLEVAIDAFSEVDKTPENEFDM